MAMPLCPVCLSRVKSLEKQDKDRKGSYFDCPNCGLYFISQSALGLLEDLNMDGRAFLSHGIWCGQNESIPFEVMSGLVNEAEKNRLPNPAEQLDKLVIFLGKNQFSLGVYLDINPLYLRAKVGAIDVDSVGFLIKAAKIKQLIEEDPMNGLGDYGIRLTIDGWQRFQDLKRGKVSERVAFMAMSFGVKEVDEILSNALRPAVMEAGFALKRVDEEKKAGLIDDLIRVSIRLSRFVIADLTCENRGAYWEAGYAEGLGKPVIYTCNKHFFENQGTHFDTNHQHTILWDLDDPEDAAKQLKATIRATLPFEAKMLDGEL